MRYFNKKTGIEINVESAISGGNWVLTTADIHETKKPEQVEETVPEINSENENSDMDGITIAQIKQELDAFGIEYNPKAKKQELCDLMMQGK